MTDKITLEKRVEKFCRSIWQAHSTSVDISQDEEFQAILAFVRDVRLEEREACAKIVEESDCRYLAKQIREVGLD